MDFHTDFQNLITIEISYSYMVSLWKIHINCIAYTIHGSVHYNLLCITWYTILHYQYKRPEVFNEVYICLAPNFDLYHSEVIPMIFFSTHQKSHGS